MTQTDEGCRVSPEPATSIQPGGDGAEVEVSPFEQTQAEDATKVEAGTQKELQTTNEEKGNDGHGEYGYESGSPSHDRTSATTRRSSTPKAKRRSLLVEDSTAMHHRASRVSITAASAPFDATYHPGKIVFFAPPRQRQRWGDTQILPRLNWGDLFFDLFYVAAAYNVSLLVSCSAEHCTATRRQ
jgi:hypothetical protein